MKITTMAELAQEPFLDHRSLRADVPKNVELQVQSQLIILEAHISIFAQQAPCRVLQLNVSLFHMTLQNTRPVTLSRAELTGDFQGLNVSLHVLLQF